MENECILPNYIVLAIFLPKIIKFSEHLTMLWQKNFWLFFSETRCIKLCQCVSVCNKTKRNL